MPDWRKQAVQERSRETEKALSRAARELLREHSFDEIRVDDVARRAGTSIGGFYARFNGKNALLHLVDIDFFDDLRGAFDEAVPANFGGSLDEVVHAFVGVMVRQFDAHRSTIVQAMKYASEDDSSEFRKRATAFNEYAHGRLRRIMSNHFDGIAHEDPTIAINMTIFIASAAAREAVLKGHLSAYPVKLSIDELIEELSRNAMRYLTGGGA